VDALEASLAGDAALQGEFDAWLDGEIARAHDGQTAFAEDVPTVLAPDDLPVDGEAAILADLSAVLPGGDFRAWEGRYRYEGTLSVPTPGLAAGEQRALLDARMDLALADLEPRGPSFVSAVAWCGDIAYGGPSATARFVVEGPLAVEGPAPAGGGGGGGCAATRTPGSGDPTLPAVLALVLGLAVARNARSGRGYAVRPAP
jgi:hypothetical protein